MCKCNWARSFSASSWISPRSGSLGSRRSRQPTSRAPGRSGARRYARGAPAHAVADPLNPSFCFRIQAIDEVSELWDLVLNSQIAVGFGSRAGHGKPAQIDIGRNDFNDPTKLLDRIDYEVLQAQGEGSGLALQFGFLNKFREGHKSRTGRGAEAIRIA